MQQIILFHLLVLLCLAAAAQPVTTIIFGSCLRQWQLQPVWDAIVSSRPDVFLFIGDNVYANTIDINTICRAAAMNS